MDDPSEGYREVRGTAANGHAYLQWKHSGIRGCH